MTALWTRRTNSTLGRAPKSRLPLSTPNKKTGTRGRKLEKTGPAVKTLRWEIRGPLYPKQKTGARRRTEGRIARLKYTEGSVEQTLVVRFLNYRCLKEGFESEEDCFGSDLTLGQWVRDARGWATHLLRKEPARRRRGEGETADGRTAAP